MTKIINSKQYDLEPRSLELAKQCRVFVKNLPRTQGNLEDGKQFVKEATELMMIFSSIMRKSE